MSNLLRSQSLLVQPFDVPIADLPLGTMGRDGLLDLLSCCWSPLLNRLGSLWLRRVLEFGERSCQQIGHGFG
jgi:hypothetical protein